LLSGLSGVTQCISKSAGVSLPAFDMHCPICSLPLAFATRLDTIPSFASYLPAPAEMRVQAREARLQEAAPNVAYRDLFVFSLFSACGTAPRARDDVTRPAHKGFFVKFVVVGGHLNNAAAAVIFVTQCKLPRATKWLLMQAG
jgi:hypothetical protein